jgi:rhamnogalacturonan acetylesterase
LKQCRNYLSAQIAQHQIILLALFRGRSGTSSCKIKANARNRWGFYTHEYLTIQVINLAKAGASTRSFISQGNWKELLDRTTPGDYVLIEMGHNDEGDPTKSDKYSERGTLPGLGDDSKTVATRKGQEKVYTFGHYLRQMIADVKSKQAIPVLSGMVPRNYWKGEVLQKEWPFATYTQQQAKKSGVEYIDHTKYSVRQFQTMGSKNSKKYYPQDNTHTNSGGAKSGSHISAVSTRT